MGIFIPDWMSKKTAKALKAVDKITDDQKLYRIALKAPDRKVRFAALKKIQDEKLLIKITDDLENFSEYERATAVKAISDPQILLNLARNANTRLRFSGLSQSVKKHGAYGCVRTAAIAQIDSEEMLEQIADSVDCDFYDKYDGSLGYHDFQPYIIKAAIYKMKDPDRLKRLALEGSSYTTSKHAVERLYQLGADTSILEDIARNAHQFDARKQAMTALSGKNFMFDRDLVQVLSDQDFLYDYARNKPDPGSDSSDYERAAAVRKLTDPLRVAEFMNFSKGEVRKAATERMKELME